ncbi:hypothetical protein [Acetobacter estunensis]|uniref:hypothetical protein n=1 Tax=Acetobacter estunensis TaxID=104097 RepID=UPI00222F8807|nr:hypothetical protein [Acetobacter estunensis]
MKQEDSPKSAGTTITVGRIRTGHHRFIGRCEMRSSALTRQFLAATVAITVSGLAGLADTTALAATPGAQDAGSTLASTDSEDKLVFNIRQANLGPGYAWGRGLLHYRGKDYDIRVEGGGGPAIGYSSACAEGTISDLGSLDKFDTTFWAVASEATAGSGIGRMALQNSDGTEIHLQVKSHGARLAAAAARLRFHVLGPSKTTFAASRCP